MWFYTGEIEMKYTMRLTEAPFRQLKNGTKTIELRLNDEKRKEIRIGDTIQFINLGDLKDTLLTKVIDIYVFDSFADLYSTLSLEDLGYSEDEFSTASSKDMDKFYTPEEQALYGVVGFRIELEKK